MQVVGRITMSPNASTFWKGLARGIFCLDFFARLFALFPLLLQQDTVALVK